MNYITSTATGECQDPCEEKIKIQTLNLKNVQKLQKVIRVKNQCLKMDLGQNPKNIITWLGSLYCIDTFIHTIINMYMILQKPGERFDLEVTEIKNMIVLWFGFFFFSFLIQMSLPCSPPSKTPSKHLIGENGKP